MSRKALILGISGQDGGYLASFLLRKGYEVHGTSRDVESQPFIGLTALGIEDRVALHSASLIDFRNLIQLISTVEPDEIYNLAGQTSVSLSFSQPVEAFESVATGTIQMLEVLRFLDRPVRFYNACSSECFGQVEMGHRCDEKAPFRPRSPYAMAKAAAFWAVDNYREAYDLFACSGILFNHESPLRSARFVTNKIVSSAVRIAGGENLRLSLGNMDIYRDWGYAPEFVEMMWRMLQRENPEDCVIATGESHSLREFVERAFRSLDLDWRDHVDVDPSLFRTTDLHYSGADPSKAEKILNWKARVRFPELVDVLIQAERERLRQN